jgi:hypothetical protein
MKITHALLSCVMTLTISCTVTTKSEETNSAIDSTAVSAQDFPHTVWEIPLAVNHWKNKDSYILAIPDSGSTVDMMSEPMNAKRIIAERTDTLQGNVTDREEITEACAPYDFYRADLEDQNGWVSGEQVMLVGALNLGTYSVNGRMLTLGAMKPKAVFEDSECYIMHTLFFYDDTRLYLIEGNPAEFGFGWPKQKHLSLVTSNPISDFDGSTEGNEFVLTWSQPYMKLEGRIVWEADHLKFKSYAETIVDMGHHDMEVQDEGTADEIKTELCTYEDASMGDCAYISFSCNDFGDAQKDESMPEAEREMWNDLLIEDNVGFRANPRYVGAKFEITYGMVDGEVCGDPSGAPKVMPVPNILRFVLKEKAPGANQ